MTARRFGFTDRLMKTKTEPTASPSGVPESFHNKFGSEIQGVLSGFDRLRLRGTPRHLYKPGVMEAYLNACHVLIKDFKHFTEGIRVKHSVNGNSIKVYDKQGSVLRVETTIVHPEEFKVYRAAEKDPEAKLGWRDLRRGLADLPRRAEVSHASNQRYLTALAAVTGTTPLREATRPICQPVVRQGQRYRPLNPWSAQDGALLEAISRGEFAINGLRNRDLQGLLYPRKASGPAEQRRRSGATTRKLRLLRAHGLLRKVSGTHRYILTSKGREVITALLAARQADVDKLTKLAA